jgi:uncharacterized protein YkwD
MRGGAGSKILVAAVLIIGAMGVLYVINYAFPELFSFGGPVFAGPIIYNTAPVNGEIRLSGGVIISAFYSSSGASIASVTLLVDGVNVTGASSKEPTSIGYSSSFSAGTHTISLTVVDDRSRSASRSWSFSVSNDIQEVTAQVLDEINTARAAAGIQNVSLLVPVSSAHRAQDMLNNQYFGHYDLSGFYPGYWYTLMGRSYLAEENIGYSYDSAGIEGFPAVARELTHTMIYDDASSGWGHRDSLMDPTNNFAEVSVANDRNRFYLVINMVKDLVDWISSPSFSNATFSCAGRLALNGSSIQSVYIYFNNYSAHDQFVYDPQLHVNVGETSYTLGEPIAGVVPSPGYYPTVETLRPKDWHVAGQNFAFSVTVNATYGPGIYTLAIFANNTLPMKNPYNSEYDVLVPVLWYALKLP